MAGGRLSQNDKKNATADADARDARDSSDAPPLQRHIVC